ncbi:MAG: ATP-binding protein [Chloroflexi bacterium]|nr:ATP-binding protein [Chloroflexota bacterium]
MTNAYHSPFFYGGMIQDPRYFVGRRVELDTILTALATLPNQAQHVNVVGPRRIGKSSLLWRVKQLAPSRMTVRVFVVYLDGQDLVTPAAFYRALAEALAAPRPEKERLVRALQAYREDGRPVVLLLDELDALLEHGFPQAFFEGLRSWMNRSLLAVVAASRKPVARLKFEHGLTSPFFNIFGERIDLGPLPEPDADALVARGRACDPPFTDAEMRWVKDWAREKHGYHPAKLQFAGYHLCREKARVRGPVALAALERKVDALWRDATRPTLPWPRRLIRAGDRLFETLGRLVHETLLRKDTGTTSRSTLRLTGGAVVFLGVAAVVVILGALLNWPPAGLLLRLLARFGF